ncbi:MAG: hypothetical protein KDA63_02290, partial [Planctomycetales bacterium]|nr:hypothetical protein [Planctomycetales bacterium]
ESMPDRDFDWENRPHFVELCRQIAPDDPTLLDIVCTAIDAPTAYESNVLAPRGTPDTWTQWYYMPMEALLEGLRSRSLLKTVDWTCSSDELISAAASLLRRYERSADVSVEFVRGGDRPDEHRRVLFALTMCLESLGYRLATIELGASYDLILLPIDRYVRFARAFRSISYHPLKEWGE